MSRLLRALRRRRAPDLSAVLAARLRAEQDDVLRRWAADLTGVQCRWLHGKDG